MKSVFVVVNTAICWLAGSLAGVDGLSLGCHMADIWVFPAAVITVVDEGSKHSCMLSMSRRVEMKVVLMSSAHAAPLPEGGRP